MKNEKNLYIIIGVMSVLVCGFWFLHSAHPAAIGGPTVTYKQVDDMRRDAKIRNEMQQKKAEVINYQTAPHLSNAYHQVEDDTNSAKNAPIKFESEKHSAATEADDDANREPVNYLESQINKRLVNEQKAAELSAVQKKQFIENYKRQALAKGYKVELNDQLVVTKVQKVGTKHAPASIQQEDVEIQDYDDDSGAE